MKVKLLSSKVIFFAITIFFIFAKAETNYKVLAQYRTVPSALNVLATGSYESLLWGEVDKKKPLYGYYKVGAALGGSPTAAAFLEVAPIAPIVFKIQKSMTYRFTKSQVFDCKNVYCYGVIDRTDASVSAAAGYNGYVGVLSYLWRNLNAPSSENSVMAEQELFLTTSGEHFYNELTLAVGYMLEDKKMIGLYSTAARFSDGDRKSNSLYAVYRWPWQEWDLTGGVGQYRTDEAFVGGQGVIFTIGKKFGESLALF